MRLACEVFDRETNAANSPAKASFGWSQTLLSGSFDGNTVESTATSLPYNVNPNEFSFGIYGAYNMTGLNGHIGRFCFWGTGNELINSKLGDITN